MTGTLIARFFFFLTFCTIPFLGGNHLPLFYITIDKFWIENWFMSCLIFLLIFIFLSGREGATLTWKKFLIFFAPFALMNVLSLLYTWNVLSTLKEVNILLWAAGVVFIVGVLQDRDLPLKALVIGAFVSSLCAMVQLTVLYPNLTEMMRNSRYALLIDTHPIPFSSFLYHNIYGGYLASILPVSLYFAIYQRKIFYSITTVCILTGLILTTSRIAIALSVLTFSASMVLLVRDRDMKRILHAAGLVCAGILIAALLMNIHTKDVSGGVQREMKYKMSNIATQIKTLNTRTEIWKGGFKAFIQKPVLGYGAGTFEYPYKKYFDGGVGTKYAHGWLIKIGVELGIVGLIFWIVYLAGFSIMIRNVFSGRKNVFLFSAVLSLFLFGLIDFSFDTPAHVITFFLLTSILIRESTVNDVLSPMSLKTKKMGVETRVMTIILLLCFIISFYFTIRINLSYKGIENGISMEENGFPLSAANQIYEDAIKKMPLNDEGFIRSLSTLIANYNTEKDNVKKDRIEQTIADLLNKMSTRQNKDSELFYIMGMGHVILGNNTKAEYYFDRALFYCPSSSYYILRVAEYYFYHRNYDMAMETISSFNPYRENYELARNPNGYYVYQMKDLEVEIMLRENNRPVALSLALENLKDAEREKYVITNARARELIKKEAVLDLLRKRVDFIKMQVEKK